MKSPARSTTSSSLRAVLLVALLALALPTAAHAKYRQFQTPTKNIACGWFKFGSKPASIRCDISSQDNPPEPKPASCEFDFGYSYGMEANGKARRACVSDAVAGPNAPILGYGETFRKGGIVCKSKESGLRCHNRKDHGWFLNRSDQTVF